MATLKSKNTIVFSEIPFSKNSHHIETSQLIGFSNQLTDSYMIEALTERYFQTDITLKSK